MGREDTVRLSALSAASNLVGLGCILRTRVQRGGGRMLIARRSREEKVNSLIHPNPRTTGSIYQATGLAW